MSSSVLMCVIENLLKWVVFWKPFVDNVQKFSTKVTFDI